MWMEVHLYQVKAESQAGNMSQRYNNNIKRPKPLRYSARDLKNLCILLENSAEGLKSRRERCWHYVVSVFENTPKHLVVQGRMQLEHSSHIVKVGVEATCLHFNSWRILKETIEPAAPFGTMPQEPWHPGKGAKPDRVIQLNCGEVRTHASYKATRTWENFNNRGTKMILLSDELWVIANNSKSFANGSKSIIRNNLGLCKHFEIYLIQNFCKHC